MDAAATLPAPPELPISVFSGDRTLDGSVDLHGRPVRKSTSGGPRAASFIIGMELCERLAFYAIQSNLLRYLTYVLQESSSDAIRNVTNWTGVSLVVPIVGSFLADAYWGRFWTIAAVSIIYVLGLLLLTLSVTLRPLKPEVCAGGQLPAAACETPTRAQVGFFYMALYLISIGTGGIKPCLEAFGADQFDDDDSEERKGKSSFFNWWYFALSIGSLIALTLLVYAENNWSWGLGFGIPTAAMAAACVLFFSGTLRYRHKLPGGSPLTQITQVLVAAVRNAAVELPADPSHLHEVEAFRDPHLPAARRPLHHTPSLRFLDKAAVLVHGDGVGTDDGAPGKVAGNAAPKPRSSWRLCAVTQVEEVKLVVRVMPVWLTTLAYGVVFAQASTVFVAQVGTMRTELGTSRFRVPPASFQAVAVLTVLTIMPIYDRVVVPAGRRILGRERGITPLQRVGAGLVVSVMCVTAAALVDVRRLRVAAQEGLQGTSEVLPMSAFWTLPQFMLLGLGDLLTLVGEQEFFYDQVPDSMRSLGVALYLSANGVGYFINTLLQLVVNQVLAWNGKQPWIQPHHLNSSRFDYFLWLVAVISALNFVAFLFVALHYRYKHVKRPYCSSSDAPSYSNHHPNHTGISCQ